MEGRPDRWNKTQLFPSSGRVDTAEWMHSMALTKRTDKRLDGNYTRMLQTILNKFWRQHPTKQQLYGHLPPITKTIQVRRTRHAGHCWRSTDEFISEILLRTPSHERAKAGRPARTYIHQLYTDTGCSLEDQPEAMDDRERWRERVREIRVDCATRWGWWSFLFDLRLCSMSFKSVMVLIVTIAIF